MVIYGDQKVVTAILKIGVVTQGPRCDDPNHLALNRSLAGGRVTDLLADGDGLTCPNQAGNVTLRRVIGDAGHGDRVAPGLAPGREGDVH